MQRQGCCCGEGSGKVSVASAGSCAAVAGVVQVGGVLDAVLRVLVLLVVVQGVWLMWG